MQLRRFTRLTNGFLVNLKAMVDVFFVWYNFLSGASDPADDARDGSGLDGPYLDSQGATELELGITQWIDSPQTFAISFMSSAV